MGDMDKEETKLDKEKAEKEEKKSKKAKKRASEAFRVEEAVKRMKEPDPELISEDADYNLLDQEIEEEYELDEKVDDNKEKRNATTIYIESYVAEKNRYRDSDREAAAKFNAVKNDDETSITESLIVDRSKIRRARKAFAEKTKRKEETRNKRRN